MIDLVRYLSIITESVDGRTVKAYKPCVRNSYILYTGFIAVDNGLDSWESLVATTLSSLMLLFYFTLFEYLDKSDFYLVHFAKFINLIS